MNKAAERFAFVVCATLITVCAVMGGSLLIFAWVKG